MTNSIVDNAATQQVSVALNQGAVNFSARIDQTDDREIDRSLSFREMEAVSLMEKGQGGKLAVEIFRPFFSKLAEVGITLRPQNKSKQKDEGWPRDFAEGNGATADSVEIKNETPVVTAIKSLKRNSDQEAQKWSGGNPPAEIFTEALKDGMLLEVMAAGQIEKAIRKRGLNDLCEKLGKTDAAGVLEKATDKAKSEIHGFILETLENELIKKTHLQDQDFTEAFKLLELARKTGLDCDQWLSEVWPKKKDDHGLYLMDVPHSATGMHVNTSTDNPNQNNAQKHGYEYEKQDENEVLVNRLRALYMQRALKGDAITHLKTEFKIRKLKNGLFKLGIFTKDLDEQIRHEAEVVAKIKIIEMLKEALIERGTFYELAGSAHELVERKLKGLLKNAERLGMPISSEEFISLRDNANRRVFELSKRELEEVRTSRSIKDSPWLEKKEKHLQKLLARLQAESKIEEPCKFSMS